MDGFLLDLAAVGLAPISLEPPLDRGAISALLGRGSLDTGAIEGRRLVPGQVHSSIARQLRLPLAEAEHDKHNLRDCLSPLRQCKDSEPERQPASPQCFCVTKDENADQGGNLSLWLGSLA